MSWNSYYDWRAYVSLPERRREAARKIARLKKGGREVSPVEIAGRKITTTFWGEAWCKNLEAYSDYSNRLPRGRTYVRNGSVIDLQIEAGRVRALVSGSEIYQVNVEIKRLVKRRWTGIKGQCAGQIDSLVELLQGSISESVMEIVSRKGAGLFPSPREISLDCSCPDWATMCKHVAATLYGVGARLDHKPELLFSLRGVDPAEMVEAAVDRPATSSRSRRARVLESDELSSVFGVDIVGDVDSGEASSKARSKPVARKMPVSRAPKTSRKTPTMKATAKKAGARRSTPKKTAATKAAAKKSAIKKKKKKPSQKLQVWIDARKRHRLSHAQVQMARDLGMNPKKLGKLDNHNQEPWKMPLRQYIESLYFDRFDKERPDVVLSIEKKIRLDETKKARARES